MIAQTQFIGYWIVNNNEADGIELTHKWIESKSLCIEYFQVWMTPFRSIKVPKNLWISLLKQPKRVD